MALRPLDFESSTSTDSVTRAASPNLLRHASLTHLLQPPPDLLLQRHVPRALDWRHDRRKVVLLRLKRFAPNSDGEEEALKVGRLYFKAPQ